MFKWTLFPSIYGSTKAFVNYLNNNSSRVDEGQRTLVRYVHDFVNTLFAVGNVNLQKEIRNLTKASLIVALIALLIALAAFL